MTCPRVVGDSGRWRKVEGLDGLIGSELNCLVFYPFPSQYEKNITSLSLVQVYCFHQILQKLKLFVGSMMERSIYQILIFSS